MQIRARYLGGRIWWLRVIFLPCQFQIWIFCYTFTYFVPFGAIENRVMKVNHKQFNGNFAEALLFEKFIFELDGCSYRCIFKITCLLSRQVVSLKKMVVSSAKFTILMVIYLYSFNLFIGFNKTGSTSVTIMCKSIENTYPLANFSIKGTRITQETIYFNFRLDISVYIFNDVNEFVSISELMQSRKVKIPINSKDITERFLFSLLDTSIM